MVRFSTTLLLGLLWSVSVLAENSLGLDKELQDLLALDIEELATISVASKKEERLKEAPGIVTVISASEISRYGARNLRDVLDRQTSMQIIGSNLFPHNRSSIRGGANSHNDTNVLILLNGRPLRESSLSSLNQDIYAYFPVSSLKQIEIIRGPGSVLYGTNAMNGTINLVTKDATDKPSSSLALGYGSYDWKQGQLSGSGKWGDLEIYGTLSGLDTQGHNRDNIVDEFGTTGTYNTGREGYHMLINAKYRGFTLNALQSNTSSDNVRSVFAFPSTTHEYDRSFIDIGYQHDFNDQWRINANASYHRHDDFVILNAASTIAENTGENTLFELNTRYSPTSKLEILTGGTFRTISNEGSPNTDTNSSSLYSQIDYQAFNWLKLIGGIQYNKPKGISGDFSPRIAAIARINDQWGLKLLSGKAFKDASVLERFVNVASIQGNPNLNSETIITFDAQLFYESNNVSFAATYFHCEQDDMITRVAGTPLTLINSGSITFDGFELEGKYKFDHGFDFIGNLSYQTNEKNDGTENATYAPDWMIKTGMSYESPRGFQFSVFNSYFTQSTLQNHQVSTVAFTNPDADSYILLTTNLNINLGKALNNSSFSNTTLSVYGDNLLDEDIFFPSINRTTVNSIPHHAGRGFYGTISIDF